MPRLPENRPHFPETLKPKEWHEIPRPHEVIAIGDLHGRFEAFLENGKHAGILKKNGDHIHWTGGDRAVVFLGDILADRFLDSPQILREMWLLRKQAQLEGGSITLLAGNHDMWGFSYLFNEEFDGIPQEEAFAHALDQGKGLLTFLELAKISIPQNVKNVPNNFHNDFIEAVFQAPEIRETIRKTIAQTAELQEIYGQYQILHRIDDTLFSHCDPTQTMIEDLIKRVEKAGSLDTALLKLNTDYQQSLRHCLAHPDARPTDDYRTIVNIYTNTNNRETFTSLDMIKKLRMMGINAIIHGHTSPRFTTHGDFPLEMFPGKLLIMTADRSALRNEKLASRRSVVTIHKNGVIVGGEENKTYRTN